ncbi:hypothetical protein B0O99DRAFT_683371 [Bisporella sp. PMI_857]|nr:hypothetical protein B0O99DRAFT_683371 [Bisporella sp. PMI_857]
MDHGGEQDDEDEDGYRDEDDNRFAVARGYDYEDEDSVRDDEEEMEDYISPDAAPPHWPDEGRSNLDLLATPAGFRDTRGLGFSVREKTGIYGKLAKDTCGRLGAPVVDESDTVILNTEALVTRLYDEDPEDEITLHNTLMVISRDLTALWASYHRETAIHDSQEYTSTIGPGQRASNFAKANFLAGLTLQIHHPPAENIKSSELPVLKPLPQILLEWLDEHHDPLPSQFEEIQAHRPSPANHALFWDTILNGLLRGRVVAVVEVLSNAGWKHAQGDADDIRDHRTAGYKGIALANIEKVITAAVQVLNSCPAVHDNWDTRGDDWTIFRVRASHALENLRNFAEGKNRDSNEISDFGISGGTDTYSRTARKAESQVPWYIYQQLQSLYGLLIGDSNVLLSNAQDWCEATVGLLVWWDDGREDRRVGLGRSKAGQRPSMRYTDSEMYLRKLRRAFDTATAESSELQVDSSNPIELGLASLLEGDNEAVVGLLRAWSGPVSSAVAEIASAAGWLPHAEPQSLIAMESLDQEDLDLLGVNSSPSKADGAKDQTLIAYARAVSQRGKLKTRTVSRDGWEIALAVLGRLESESRSKEMVGDFLKRLSLDSATTVDKAWQLLHRIGMGDHAESVAESYANVLANSTHKYGEALWYYALAHKAQKAKDVLDLLISYSLMQSTAFPTDSELDDYLRRLIAAPKNTLVELSRMDVEAAELLHLNLSGYATLRRFYILRDQEVNTPIGEKPQLGSIARKEEAAAALLAVITSSDDNIRGGLFDEERGAVVGVDYLLALLGESMVFVNQSRSSLTVTQIDILLKAIEDLQTVGPRVYTACSEFLQAVIASGQGLKGSSPSDMLRKSVSNLSGTSNFSLVGSSMVASQLKQSMSSSGVLVKGNVKRGWDWRSGISATTTAEDVLRILRLGLAKDLAKAWLVEVDNRM